MNFVIRDAEIGVVPIEVNASPVSSFLKDTSKVLRLEKRAGHGVSVHSLLRFVLPLPALLGFFSIPLLLEILLLYVLPLAPNGDEEVSTTRATLYTFKAKN